MRRYRGQLIVLGFLALAACQTPYQSNSGPQSISIAYDPYDFNPADLQAEADAHCSAYGLAAVYDDETIDSQSVRWRYRHYNCY